MKALRQILKTTIFCVFLMTMVVGGRGRGVRCDSCRVTFEACSAFTRVTACTLAPSPIRDALSEGFSHFVTSIAAPVASGWSGCRVGLAPTGKRRLVTAHTLLGHRPARRQAPPTRFRTVQVCPQDRL